MNKFRLTISALAIAMVTLAFASVAQAQATRTWVSGVGDDVNPCSRTAPCKTFAGAISKTATGGEISVLDPGGFGAINITKSITINGTHGQGYGSILAALVNGVIINNAAAVVKLVSLDINGAGTGINGIQINAAASVHVEDTKIDGFTNRGINDIRTGNGSLFVTGCTIRNTVQSGLVVIPGAAATVNAMIDNTIIERSTANSGLAVDARTICTVRNSFIVGHNQSAIFAGGTSTQMNIINCVLSHSGLGITASAPAVVRLIDSTITNNGTSMTGQAQVSSNGNNWITGNTTNTLPSGTALSPS